MRNNDCASRKWVDGELLEERLHNICKNTCQYAKKGDRPNVMCPLCWLDDIYGSIDELAVEKVDAIPAAPREMSAREALLARRLNDIIDELQKQADVYNERAKELLKVEDGQVSQYTWAVSLRETYRRTIKTLEDLLCEAERL